LCCIILSNLFTNKLLNFKKQRKPFSVDRKELAEHRLAAVHLLGCGICGEMSDTRDGVKSCFFSHLVYVHVYNNNWSTAPEMEGTVWRRSVGNKEYKIS